MAILMAIGSADFTGAARMLFAAARALKAAGHRVIVVTGQRPPIGESSVIDALRSNGIEVFEESGFEKKLPCRRLIARISRLVQNEDISCLISVSQQDFKVLPYVAKQTSVKLVYYVQSLVKFSGSWWLQTIKRRIYRRFVSQVADKLICVSDATRAQHVNEFSVPQHRVVVVENGIDRSRYRKIPEDQRISIRKEFGVADHELMILNIGRLTLLKGQEVLLRALSSKDLSGQPFKLVLVGAATMGLPEDVTYISKLRQLAESPSLAGRVVFAGWRDNIPAILRSGDLYFHSSSFEGFPGGLATIEAMASELPVAFTDCAGALTGFIPGHHGYLARAGDVMAFETVIKKLFSLSKIERQQMGRAAEELVMRNYDVTSTAHHFVSTIEQVIEDDSDVSKARNTPSVIS